MPISAIVVGLNEAKLLTNCLESILFCQDITYFDLGSNDNSNELAKRFGANVISHQKVLRVEIIHSKYIKDLTNNWVLFIDPDEVVSSELSKDIISLINEIPENSNVGSISVPIIYYFKNKPLKGTPWAYNLDRTLLAHKERFSFTTDVHSGRILQKDFICYKIKNTGSNVLHHYWMQGYKKLISKHLRYLKNEGESRFNKGLRSTLKLVLLCPYRSFKFAFYNCKGYKDGITGLFLSIFWMWYQTSAEIALLSYQKNVPSAPHTI